MDNPETQKSLGTRRRQNKQKNTTQKTDRAIKNGQPRDTEIIGNKTKTKQTEKHNIEN
jgi:hypothetical protein